jgi:hypothetical protein
MPISFARIRDASASQRGIGVRTLTMSAAASGIYPAFMVKAYRRNARALKGELILYLSGSNAAA